MISVLAVLSWSLCDRIQLEATLIHSEIHCSSVHEEALVNRTRRSECRLQSDEDKVRSLQSATVERGCTASSILAADTVVS